MQENCLCQRCHEEEIAPIWKAVYIYHDFDATGQEFDPIHTDTYDIVGFELYCTKCNYEYYILRKAEEESDELPF